MKRYLATMLIFITFIFTGCGVSQDKQNEKEIEELAKQISEADSVSIYELNGFELIKLKPKYTELQNKYNELLIKNNNTVKIADYYLQSLNNKLNAIYLFENYKDKIEVYEVTVEKTEEGLLGLFGKIKNKSDKTFQEIEIIVYFLDNNGNTIYEEDFHPVLSNSYNFSSKGPLKPNYIQKFGYRLDSIPSEWSKKVKVVVSDLRELSNEN